MRAALSLQGPVWIRRLSRLTLSAWLMAAGVQAAEGPSAYLDAARRADLLDDALARCLAYPDLPGTRWPAGQARALCELAHGRALTLDDIRAHLERGQIDKLESLFRQDLERHLAPAGASEIIHRDFAAIDASADADALTERWLERAPGSAYANTARARHLLRRVRVLRGASELADVQPATRAVIGPLAERALDLLGRALRIEPRLIHAYVELAELGTLIDRAELIDATQERSAAYDPGCAELARVLMAPMGQAGEEALPFAQAYAAELRPALERRPQLAAVIAMPEVFQAQAHTRAGRHKEAEAALRAAAQQAASAHTLTLWAAALARLPGHDRAERLQVLLQAGRFGEADEDREASAMERGRALVRAGEHAWTLRSLTRLAPQRESPELHELLALVHTYLKRYDEAERHLLALAADPLRRPMALRSLIAAMREAGKWNKVAQYAALAANEAPRALDMWHILGIARFRSGDREGALQAFETILRKTDHTDPAMAPRIAWIRQAIGWIKQPDGEDARPPDL